MDFSAGLAAVSANTVVAESMTIIAPPTAILLIKAFIGHSAWVADTTCENR
jgi:hypothetical protein